MNRTALSDSSQATGEFSRDAVDNGGNHVVLFAKGNRLCIEIDLEKPTPSSSGKTLVVASSRGNAVTTAIVDGKPVTIGLNAYIKP